jgi:formylmethanofuran dehydrogenase subunit E
MPVRGIEPKRVEAKLFKCNDCGKVFVHPDWDSCEILCPVCFGDVLVVKI